MSRIVRSTDVHGALKSRQRGFLLNPFRFGSGGSAGDPLWNNVVLLCNFTTNLNDVKGKTATTFGGVAASGGSVTFDGVDDYFTFADSVDFAFGSGEFTIEALVTLGAGVKAANTYYTLLHQNTSNNPSNNSLYIYFESRTGSESGWRMAWFNGSNTAIFDVGEGVNATSGYTEGVEYHIAIERYVNAFTLYVNGVAKALTTYTGSLPDSVGVLQVGRDSPSNGYFKGGLNALRITKGVARYKGAFTPPTDFIAYP